MSEGSGNQPLISIKLGKISLGAWAGQWGITWQISKRYFNKKTQAWEFSKYYSMTDAVDVIEALKQLLVQAREFEELPGVREEAPRGRYSNPDQEQRPIPPLLKANPKDDIPW